MLAGNFVLLTREQISTLLPGRTVRGTNYRLQKLVANGYLARRYPTGPLAVRIPLYYLGSRAAEGLGLEPDDRTVAVRRRQAASVRESALAHLVLVNWVEIKFVTAERESSDYKLHAWMPQYDRLWSTLNEDGFPLRPDGYAEFEKDALMYRVFVELDRGTERGGALRRKLDAYEEYALSRRFEAHFSAPAFRVLFIAPSERRTRQLLRVMKLYKTELFWVLPLSEFLIKPLFEAKWRSGEREQRYSLLVPL